MRTTTPAHSYLYYMLCSDDIFKYIMSKQDTRTPKQILADLRARAVRKITMDDLADFRRQADKEAEKPLLGDGD